MIALVLNGPNLNRLGTREPEIYGRDTLESIERDLAGAVDLDLEWRQTNSEAEMIDWVHGAIEARRAVIMNPGAFTHYSYALRDACAALTSAGGTLIEVHLSNPHARERFRHESVISPVATGTIAGFGALGYRLAVDAVIARQHAREEDANR